MSLFITRMRNSNNETNLGQLMTILVQIYESFRCSEIDVRVMIPVRKDNLQHLSTFC